MPGGASAESYLASVARPFRLVASPAHEIALARPGDVLLRVLVGSVFTSDTLQAEDLVAARAALDTKFSGQLKELAVWCDEQKLARESAKVCAWDLPREPYTRYLVILPDAADPVPDKDASESLQQWHERFQSLRRAQADALFAAGTHGTRSA